MTSPFRPKEIPKSPADVTVTNGPRSQGPGRDPLRGKIDLRDPPLKAESIKKNFKRFRGTK